MHRLTAPLHVEHEIGFERIEFHFINKASKSPNLITKFVSFSWFVQGTTEYLSFAAISKLIAAAVTYPYQVVRARMQDHHHSYAGTWDCVKQTWRYERMPGFYKGLAPYLLHVMPNICLVMIIYEKFANT